VPGFVPEGIAGYFIIKNSWGCDAGDGGFYYIPDTYIRRYFTQITALNFGNQRSAAWQAQKNPSIYTIGSNRIQTDLRTRLTVKRWHHCKYKLARVTQATPLQTKTFSVFGRLEAPLPPQDDAL
jgi:hypothetical protein